MVITLDGSNWQTEVDFIEDVPAGVQAPSLHGRNYNALRDSFFAGHVNGVGPCYNFVVRMPTSPISEVEDAVRYFMDRVSDWRAEGEQLSARVAKIRLAPIQDR